MAAVFPALISCFGGHDERVAMNSLCSAMGRLSVGASTSAFRGQAVAGPSCAPSVGRTSVVVMAAGKVTRKLSVLKRQRVSEAARLYNRARKSAVATRVKKVLSACAASEPLDKVETLLSEAFSEIDKAVSKGVIHKNTAARRKSRITHAKKALEAAALQ